MKALDTKGAALLLGVSTKTVLRLFRDGEISAVRIGRCLRFFPADLDAFIRRNRINGARADNGSQPIYPKTYQLRNSYDL